MSNIEKAARVLSSLTTCDGEPYPSELHRRQAQALADAGLIAPEGTRTEWGMETPRGEFSLSGTEDAARFEAKQHDGIVKRRKVTEWTVAP